MNKIDRLTPEEEALILKLRAEKEAQEVERLQKSKILENEFKKVREKALTEIREALDRAHQCLDDAEEISEKFGIPFESEVVNLSRSRRFVPSNFSSIWNGLDKRFLEDICVYLRDSDGDLISGWEYWSASNLECI